MMNTWKWIMLVSMACFAATGIVIACSGGDDDGGDDDDDGSPCEEYCEAYIYKELECGHSHEPDFESIEECVDFCESSESRRALMECLYECTDLPCEGGASEDTSYLYCDAWCKGEWP